MGRILAGVILFAVATNVWIITSTMDQIYSDLEYDGDNRTALVLGTSYNTSKGNRNPFFYNRMNTAAQLYHANQINNLILSGSSAAYYNEPEAMLKSLEELEVPASIMVVDSLGYRTLASIVRCKEVYQKNKVIIITQRFHAYRALFISNFYGLDAVVVATESMSVSYRFGVLMREFFARPLAVIDLYILQRGT